MQLDGAIFAIQRRTVGGCIDLGIVFLREHFGGVLRLTCLFAIPVCVLTWWLVSRQEWNFFAILMLFATVSPFFGSALVAAAGQRVFGDRFSAWMGMRALLGRLLALGVLIVIARAVTLLGLMALVVPGYCIATRYGFLAEVLLLERQRLSKYESRLSDLQTATFGTLLGRLITIMIFFWISVASLFVLLDLTSGYVFGTPILIGRTTSMDFMVEEITNLLIADPLVLTSFVAVMWLVYPVARLAWFFCYLDVRIRKEGWDVELDFRIESQRLGEAA